MFEALQDALKCIFPNLAEENYIISDDLLEVLYEDDGSHYQTKRIEGTVTKVRESQGLAVIDHEIYMDLSIPVVGGKKIRVGDHLILEVNRRSEKNAWIVHKVDMVNRNNSFFCDDEFQNQSSHLRTPASCDDYKYLKSKILIGKVTDITNNVSVNAGQVYLKSKEADGIKLCVGDWVSCSVLYDPEDVDQKLKCTKATPLRQWKLEGRITMLNGNCGIIDDRIFFDSSVCING